MIADGVTDGRIAKIMNVPLRSVIAFTRIKNRRDKVIKELNKERRENHARLNRKYCERDKAERARIKRELLG